MATYTSPRWKDGGLVHGVTSNTSWVDIINVPANKMYFISAALLPGLTGPNTAISSNMGALSPQIYYSINKYAADGATHLDEAAQFPRNLGFSAGINHPAASGSADLWISEVCTPTNNGAGNLGDFWLPNERLKIRLVSNNSTQYYWAYRYYFMDI